MWRRIVSWYRDWDNEQLAVLEHPALAASVRPGYRRHLANRLATLSPLERQQLRAFALTYRGRRLTLVIARLALVSTLGGVLLHLSLPEKTTWLGSLIAGNMFGFVMACGGVSVWFSYRRMIRDKFKRLILGMAYGLVPIAFLVVIELIQGAAPMEIVAKLGRVLPIMVGVAIVTAVPFFAIAYMRNREHEAVSAQLQRDAERERLARELSESQLRLLRAQVEPHFLFNTLGAVQQLAEHGAPRAAELTANLIAFLRASLSEMRSEQATLDDEFGLVDAYLRVMQVRLGARLRFTLDLPAELTQVRLPSMMVLTLVENAIKHGIEPSLRGGDVSVSAQAQGGAVLIRVQDSGAGISPTPGKGMGLDNVRERLQLAFGPAASLALHEAAPGLIAEIRIPLARETQ
jgi:sensor histidine kinase YesM